MSGQTEQQVKTPYQAGLRDGVWTAESVRECGWESAAACLENEEKNYQEQVEGLTDLYHRNPEYARQHAEFIEGVITAARSTLRALIQEGY